MKKYLILCSFIIVLAGCSTDSADPIIDEVVAEEVPPPVEEEENEQEDEEEPEQEGSIDVDDFSLTNIRTEAIIGDPGIGFDETKFDDANYPQMREWATAGVTGGIPLLSETDVKKAIKPTNSARLNESIQAVADLGGGILKLTNGTYTIDALVLMKSNVRLVGESREGVILNITLLGTSGDAILFEEVDNAGIDRVTIQGGFGQANDFTMSDVKPDFLVNSVGFVRSNDCWLSDVTITDSGKHAFSTWRGGHHTFRNCEIERSWNKGTGGKGYVEIQSPYCLMYNTSVKKMRHIAIQSVHAQYNVLYKNTVEQDFNFHNGDSGNNLIEQNINTLPEGLGREWNAVMGPWSSQHTISVRDNYVFRNTCLENNNDNGSTFSDDTKVYLGARAFQQDGGVFVTTDNIPSGGTFYPINLD